MERIEPARVPSPGESRGSPRCRHGAVARDAATANGPPAWLALLAPLLLALALAACGGGDAAAPEEDGELPPPSGRPALTLPDTIEIVSFVEGLRARMPARGSGGYRPPLPFEVLSLRQAFDSLVAGNLEAADRLLDRHDYDLVWTVERGTGDSVLVLGERPISNRHWGTYVFNPSRQATPTDIHVDHPLFDVNTDLLGARMWQRCRCRWLFVAGAHRFANEGDVADMARQTESMFQVLHEAVAPDGFQAMSVHGFSAENHTPPTSTSDFVLSNGATSDGLVAPVDLARDLRLMLREAGFVVGLVGDDLGYDVLTGSPNPQGIWSNENLGRGRWIHVEVERRLRTDAALREAAAQVLGLWGKLSVGGA
ncbi:MAG: hypothetical protein D6701_10135 [Gemmatimonadetes bacterium]|nr:MAG: hypothetical protein D6701_10135 [Gemmatimonadota bacterium]